MLREKATAADQADLLQVIDWERAQLEETIEEQVQRVQVSLLSQVHLQPRERVEARDREIRRLSALVEQQQEILITAFNRILHNNSLDKLSPNLY